MMRMQRLDTLPEPRGETFVRHVAPAFEERVLPGFVVNGVTYESHHITLYIARAGAVKEGKTRHHTETEVDLYMRMRHGGGTEYYAMDCHLLELHVDSILALDDRTLYAMLYFAWDVRDKAITYGAERASDCFRQAFVEGRLKRRKIPGQNRFKVWIEPERETAAAD